MIKKFIFLLAIMLSLTTHHAVCIGNEDDEFDIPTISARLVVCNEELEKEREKNSELTKKSRHSASSASISSYSDSGFLCGKFLLNHGPSLTQSYNRIAELYAQKQQLKALLKKVEEAGSITQ